MGDDGLGDALEQPAGLGMGVVDLIKAAETLKQSGATAAVSALYATWIQHNRADPLLYAVLFNYSVVLSDSGDLDRARRCLEQSIQLKPDFMPARINLGRVHERLGAIDAAIGSWSAVADGLGAVTGAAVSHKITALNQMARTLEAVGRDDAAEEVLRQSLDIDTTQREVVQHLIAARQRSCAWPIVAPTERVSREVLMKGLSPLSAGAFSDDPLLQLAIAAHYNAVDVGLPPARFVRWPKAETREGPLRIGYLSSDLREHAVGHLMAEVFGLHDRTKVEVTAYYCGIPARDPMHLAFKAAADRWVDVSQMDDDAAARRIVEDGIQILVDVNGYTREGRTKLIARRPAPVIVNWLGYPGTVASPYHHYIVADDFIIPEDHERYYTEKVLRLPCYQPNNRNRVIAETRPSRAEAGLPETGTVFCCFNGSHKITRFTFDRWLAILAGVPGSVLWLLTGSETANARLKAAAAEAGIAPERIVFAPKVANPDHLARYPLADLFLDCTPYGAHTTASDALFMGRAGADLAGAVLCLAGLRQPGDGGRIARARGVLGGGLRRDGGAARARSLGVGGAERAARRRAGGRGAVRHAAAGGAARSALRGNVGGFRGGTAAAAGSHQPRRLPGGRHRGRPRGRGGAGARRLSRLVARPSRGARGAASDGGGFTRRRRCQNLN